MLNKFNTKRGRRAACGVLVLGITAAATAQQPTFTSLSNPFVGGYVDGVFGVSGDGSVVVGYSYSPSGPEFGDRSFRWIRGIGFDNPGPSQGSVLSLATGVSADGNVVVGYTGHAQFGDQEAWVRVGASRGHVGSPSGTNFSSLLGISADGAIAVGFGGQQSNPNSAVAAYYDTIEDQWTSLGTLPGQSWSKATAANADGSVIVGRAVASPMTVSAFRWTSANGIEELVGPPEWTLSIATAVSADGSIIVGYDETGETIAWRWSEADGMQQIGDSGPMWATGVSPDGQVVVGIDQRTGSNEPFIWDAEHGVQNLRTLLEAQGLGAAMDGWYMCCAETISQTAGVYWIAGAGGDPAGYIAGWVVSLDSLDGTAPCPGDLNGDQFVDLGDLTTVLSNFGTPSGAISSDGDLDGDGDVDLADLSSLLGNFGSTCL